MSVSRGRSRIDESRATSAARAARGAGPASRNQEMCATSSVQPPGAAHDAPAEDDGGDPTALLTDRGPAGSRHDVPIVGTGTHYVLVEARQQSDLVGKFG